MNTRDQFVAYPHREYLGGSVNRLRRFMVGDRVSHNGKVGIILATVANSPDEYIVECGGACIVSENELQRAKATDKEPTAPKQRRKKNEEE